ncbi:hypothetical protein ABFS82_02G110400 [Erythranthe guttata]|uniref:Myb/SANT-like DNA-binding domain-containing protein n=1 Tax=Erythranthe guttata TaxID=4155 RepID=A0A022RD62_ERYGU|nr:PREDICTED: trihelix transcription factor ASIL2 [Erythranthe guttata]EYU38287.1 hypothetical protein MIMGU_mgv1a008598mg [Erythranthe guttata]|eukprot:XP_012836432.1 PREDICTED: trihelix transcription factor ASIL2 [Erythranthe guttata]
MERDHNHDHHNHKNQETPPQPPPSLPPSYQNPKEIIFTDQSPRKHIITVATNNNNTAAATNDRLKRDEWSEGAVSSLLEAYEAKWTLRNRAKLKGQDWDDVAKHVSCRGGDGGGGGNNKSAKTQTQCKNKIESMKKRYRSESAAAAAAADAAAAASSWPLYSRMDLLLRGINNNGPPPVLVVEPPPVEIPPPPSTAVAAVPLVAVEMGSVKQNSRGSDVGGGDRLAKGKGDGTNNGPKLTNQEPEKNPIIDDTDSSTPAIYTEREKPNKKVPIKSNKDYAKSNNKKRKREDYNWEVGESIRWFAEVMVRSEQARMETMREIERMRIEAEAKRGEMELKRTEIIANTQLQIAKLFAKASVQDNNWKKPT